MLAKSLIDEYPNIAANAVVSFYEDGDTQGHIPANVFASALSRDKRIKLEQVPFKGLEDFRKAWGDYLKAHPNLETVVIWPGAAEANLLNELALQTESAKRLFLPSTRLQGDLSELPELS